MSHLVIFSAHIVLRIAHKVNSNIFGYSFLRSIFNCLLVLCVILKHCFIPPLLSNCCDYNNGSRATRSTGDCLLQDRFLFLWVIFSNMPLTADDCQTQPCLRHLRHIGNILPAAAGDCLWLPATAGGTGNKVDMFSTFLANPAAAGAKSLGYSQRYLTHA